MSLSTPLLRQWPGRSPLLRPASASVSIRVLLVCGNQRVREHRGSLRPSASRASTAARAPGDGEAPRLSCRAAGSPPVGRADPHGTGRVNPASGNRRLRVEPGVSSVLAV